MVQSFKKPLLYNLLNTHNAYISHYHQVTCRLFPPINYIAKKICCRKILKLFSRLAIQNYMQLMSYTFLWHCLVLWPVPVVALPFVLIVRQNGVGRLSGRVLGLNHRKIPHYVIIVTTDPEQETLKQFRAQESKTLQLTQLGVGMFPLFGPIQKLYMWIRLMWTAFE